MQKIVLVVALAVGTGSAIIGQAVVPRPRNATEFDALFQQVSNWGRWGKDDQLGAANLVTPSIRRRAAALVREAISVSLARTSMTEPAEDNPNPFERNWNPAIQQPLFAALVDNYKVSYHGIAHSHIDALCHVVYNDRAYNGHPRADIETERGCAKLGIDNLKNGVITRGILLDIPRLRNLPFLDPGTPIHVEDLEAWERKAGLRIATGDAIFVRTGRWARRDRLGPWTVAQHMAGLHASVAPWVRSRGVAFIGSDAALDVVPSGVEGITFPVHVLMIAAMGLHILDNQDLEALAATAARLNRWEFMLTVAPVPVSGGTGSPVNAVATF